MKRLLSALFLSVSAGLPIAAHALTQSFTLTPGPSNGRGSVQYIDFAMLSTASIQIQAFGEATQGPGFNRDPEIILFRNDGYLDFNDYLARDDDSGVGLDASLTLTLSAGNYRLAVSEWPLAGSDAISGINYLDMPFSQMLVTLDSSGLGQASVVAAVPEPETYALMLACMAVLVGTRQLQRPRESAPLCTAHA